jgi:hypothetical protein
VVVQREGVGPAAAAAERDDIGRRRKERDMFEAIVGLAKQLIEASGSIVGVRHGTEEPMYTVEQVNSGVEIRHYGPRIAAQTTVAADEEAARSKGFSRLARYIFGANHDGTKIAMTAPVA